MSYDTIAYLAKLGGTVFFSLSFIIIVGYALWPKNKKRFEHASNIPLESDDHPSI